jgi:hypothetical protein
MARPTPTTISCPACGQPFNAILEQILDIDFDPTAKERLLSGRVNLITCPHCGYRGVVGTPLMYHDAGKQLAVVYVPMELDLSPEQRERIIGDMANALMRALPEDAPKGYLLQPKTALTVQGLVDQVLEADGITQEMLEAERSKIGLIDRLAEAGEEEREQLLAENQDLFDLGFLELLSAAAQAASQSEESRRALRLLNILEYLTETTEAGQKLKAQQEALVEASQELEALGEDLTREAFVELLLGAAGNPAKVDALATLGRPLLDYTTFQLVTQYITDTQDEEERHLYEGVRERLLEISAMFEQQSRAMVKRASDTLRMLLQAPDLGMAIRSNLDRIDDIFLQVLQANLDEARKAGNVEVSSRLKEVRDEVLRLLQMSAPPEIRFINDLLAVESDEESLELLHSRQSELNEAVLHIMGELATQLREGGNVEAAQRLDLLYGEAQTLLP